MTISNEITGFVEEKKPTFTQRLRTAVTPLLASKTAIVGLFMVLFWIFVAVFAPMVTQYDPLEQDYLAVNQGPTQEHILGTDDLGRDLWSRIVYGARITLTVAPIAVLCALLLGVTMGLVSAYYGGLIDEIVMRILDAMMAFPRILLYLIIIAALGPSVMNIIIAIMVAGVPGIARLVRSMALDIRSRDYVAAAEQRGESALYIMFVEILPNSRGPIIVDAMLRVGYAIFSIGTLGFLGLGIAPPTPEWGSMVARGHTYIFINPWPAFWPAAAIASLVVGLNLFADGLREESMRYQ